mmetsp:Transcript_3387/g.8814  ORF Transcript_3387/g.8814 Transcript_3387/m.8814 type:complete len:114 (-) Transcript_3387:271-612(-)|eukprot:CAMPEP_0119411718 /NCGR_PEP_ID=MMETSP1335-20130426/4379_1 /TAXON_ID=259385 /ORGANISM="Chrysoculter rhomboideus, Strain RCC1486" /LENGTH=113 /DNA_ID=CAMNT_0007436387 /DNA_START=30 /DNA_END=371 /DNA_ORIENTATION=-
MAAEGRAFTLKEGPAAELEEIRSQMRTKAEAEAEAINMEPVSYVSRKEMHDAKLPLEYRDYCAHLLIPLNRCRAAEFYLPWKCETLRNAHEKCQHNDYLRRRALKVEEMAATE